MRPAHRVLGALLVLFACEESEATTGISFCVSVEKVTAGVLPYKQTDKGYAVPIMIKGTAAQLQGSLRVRVSLTNDPSTAEGAVLVTTPSDDGSFEIRSTLFAAQPGRLQALAEVAGVVEYSDEVVVPSGSAAFAYVDTSVDPWTGCIDVSGDTRMLKLNAGSDQAELRWQSGTCSDPTQGKSATFSIHTPSDTLQLSSSADPTAIQETDYSQNVPGPLKIVPTWTHDLPPPGDPLRITFELQADNEVVGNREFEVTAGPALDSQIIDAKGRTDDEGKGSVIIVAGESNQLDVTVRSGRFEKSDSLTRK